MINQQNLIKWAIICGLIVIFIPKTLTSSESYVWKNVEIKYPSNWKVEMDREQDGNRNVSFIPSSPKPSVRLILTIMPSERPPDQYFKEKPGLAALRFGLPLAKRSASQKNDDSALVGYNEVQLGDGPASASQILVPSPEGNMYMSVHSFVILQNNILLFGAVVMPGQIGGVPEDAVFHQQINQAYEILRNLHIK
jgi:hypothetical protein